MGDDVALKLRQILEEKGITLLLLDWSPDQLPPLVVLLASAISAVNGWFDRHRPQAAEGMVQALGAVAEDARFARASESLARELTAAHVGLDALRHQTHRWLLERFAEREKSQRAFGQYINIEDPQAAVVQRAGMDAALTEAIAAAAHGDASFVVLLGPEGSGKTWLTTGWWRVQPNPPILLFIPRNVHLCSMGRAR